MSKRGKGRERAIGVSRPNTPDKAIDPPDPTRSTSVTPTPGEDMATFTSPQPDGINDDPTKLGALTPGERLAQRNSAYQDDRTPHPAVLPGGSADPDGLLDTPTFTDTGNRWPDTGGGPILLTPDEAMSEARRQSRSAGGGGGPACCLCGKPVERWPGGGGWGHNPQPLADPPARACDNCNQTRVIPARLGQQGLDGRGHNPRRGLPLHDPLKRDLMPPRPVVEGGGRPPQVRSAVDVAALRAWLVRQWQPGGAYERVARTAARRAYDDGDTPRSMRYRDEAETERVALQRAVLYYVEPGMVDLLLDVQPAVPPDVHPDELIWPGDSGLVVFAKPIPGVAVDRPMGDFPPTLTAADVDRDLGTHATVVHAVMFNRSKLPPWDDDRYGPNRVTCLSLHSYRCLDLDAGLDPDDLAAFTLLTGGDVGSFNPQYLGHEGNAQSWSVHGTFWVPMGHSDWPVSDTLDTTPPWCQPGPQWASFREDRQLVTALFTLLAQEGISSRTVERPPRALARRLQRDGADPSPVTVVTLRKPRAEPHPDFTEAPPGATTRTHRWLVPEHPCWQPCGPGRQERKLIIRAAHIKGPPGAPLIVKTKVNRWIR